jgi:hypothetical protein
MADYSKRKDKSGAGKLEPLNPQEALEYLERKQEEESVDAPEENGNGNGAAMDKAAKEAQLLGSTKEAIQLRMAEIRGELLLRKAELKGQIDTIKASESAKEKAGKHLAVFGAFYLCLLVLAFLGSVQFTDGENLAIVATLITLVVTQISSILKGITDVAEKRDPTELMHDIVQQQLENDHEKER